METTFITIHDLSPDAHILYSSDSIVDILGYQPDEVVNQSCWNYFHPDELPLAQARFGKGVEMDKAAVIAYCRMRSRDNQWVGCEIVFTIVHDVMVGCTSTYKRGMRSATRAAEAPIVRRLFSSSPRDPRYHMLSHLSAKFSLPAKQTLREPRAALFLNRYTRTLTIMYATDGLSNLLGMTGDDLRGKSFYYCIQESCLQDAVRCLENAKANDSIAYMRFVFRDPRDGDSQAMDIDAGGNDAAAQSSDEEMGGVSLQEQGRNAQSVSSTASQTVSSNDSSPEMSHQHPRPSQGIQRASTGSGASSAPSNPHNTHEAMFGESSREYSSSTSMSDLSPAPAFDRQARSGQRTNDPARQIELEAVISCTSDGLVVCLREARPFPPDFVQRTALASRPTYFAVPWSIESTTPSPHTPYHDPPRPTRPSHFATQPPLYNHHSSTVPPYQHQSEAAPAAYSDYMTSIRDCAVFAWALTGINGTLAQYSQGKPHGEAQPAAGLPIWDPSAHQVDDPDAIDQKPVDQLSSSSLLHNSYSRIARDPFGDPGLSARGGNGVERAAPAYAPTRIDGTIPTSQPPPQLPRPGL